MDSYRASAFFSPISEQKPNLSLYRRKKGQVIAPLQGNPTFFFNELINCIKANSTSLRINVYFQSFVAWVLLHLLLVINVDYSDQLQILGTNLLQKLPGGVLNFSIYLSVNFQLQTNVWKNRKRYHPAFKEG